LSIEGKSLENFSNLPAC